MLISEEIKKIRDGDFILHCVHVEVFQTINGGIKMSGHGTIKINSVGTVYLEFICTYSENVPHTLFNKTLPKDPLSHEQKLSLRAQTIDGDMYESDGFSIEINIKSSQPPAHHYIFLSKIHSFSTARSHESEDDNYLYFEFAEDFKIPANKSNSVVSSLGSESYSWNQTVLEMNGFSISMVKHTSYTEVHVSGCFEPEDLLKCMKFYIGFSSASMPQFFYILKRTNEEKKESIFSIVNKQKFQRSSSPMIGNVANEKYRGSAYHYRLLENIISLHQKNPKQFESVYSQWERVWHSFQSKNSIMILTLSVAIEGILNDIYIPAIKEKINNKEIDNEITEVKEKIKKIELTENQRTRILSSISYWKNVTAAKALDYLIGQGIITNTDKKLWQRLRNESAHPKVREVNLDSEALEREKVSSCLNLFHKLILNTLAFSGPIVILKAGQKPDIKELIHKEILS